MRVISQLEDADQLDPVVTVGQRAARSIRPGRIRDALHGVWLGHPLHPVLVQLPVGAWLSASALDLLVPRADAASRRLVAAGLVASAPAIAAGAVDWSEQHEQQMRVGVVHALANSLAVGLYGASLIARNPRAGRVLRLAGLTAAGLGGLLGGHISFRLAGGANHAEAVPHVIEPGWHHLAACDDLPEGKPVRKMVGEVPVVAVRTGDQVQVLADRCSHMSGPLSDGELADGCLTCPWHGSVFRLADGSVARGPATAPQPVFRARVDGGMVQVCLPGAG
jgi:nitrite reductase/ring-hydroxylating ferredoxin subunit/uncharacterized membrane protein